MQTVFVPYREGKLIIGKNVTHLTGLESRMLQVFHDLAPSALGIEKLISEIWPTDKEPGDPGNVAYVTLHSLMRKMREGEPVIENIRGVGYRPMYFENLVMDWEWRVK